MDLENKVALVTGAGVRIGQAVAVKLGQLGMRLVIHYHHSEAVSYTHLTLPTIYSV